MSNSRSVVWLAITCSVLWSGDATAGDEERPPEDILVQRDLRYRYGPSTSWKLDLAMPKGMAAKPRPAIVVIHGGGWIEGDKSSFSTWKNRPPGNIFDFAKLGFVAATINYQLSPEAPYPAALKDCRAAVRWLRGHAATYDIEAEAIGAWGNSAGGHLALLLGLDAESAARDRDAPFPDLSSRVQAVVSDSGPIDLRYQYEHQQITSVIERFLGGPPEGTRLAEYERASPIHHVSTRKLPLMLIYGTADTQVGVETADRFVAALREAGHTDVSYHRLGAVGHCPHSLVRVPWLVPAVDEFFMRALQRGR